MNLRELEAQAEFLAPVLAAAVAKAVAPLREQIMLLTEANTTLSKRLDELPTIDLAAVAALVVMSEPDLAAIAALVPVVEPIPGRDAEPVDLVALAHAAAALIEVPEPIPGRDAEPVDLTALAQAAAALIEVPEPIPGKDAEPVDLAAVAALVVVPEPIPGRDADPVDVDAIARAAAALVPAQIVPQPEHGRDALDLEILPAIDETKQYPRGTYAAHRGGLWKSYERTHGPRGWECIVDGIDGVTVTQDSVREFSIALSKSSGGEVVQKFALPIQIYKGVYRDDEVYEAHDNVTWAGSQWTSNKAANTDKPGSSDGWTLVVKAGRPGKDLRENASTFDPAKGVSLK